MRKFNVSIPVPSMADIKDATNRTMDSTSVHARSLRNKAAARLAISEDGRYTAAELQEVIASNEQDEYVKNLARVKLEELMKFVQNSGVNPNLLGQGDPNARIVDVS